MHTSWSTFYVFVDPLSLTGSVVVPSLKSLKAAGIDYEGEIGVFG